ncbi:MAG TPA: SoxR reducing system RseC family protein [Bacteroidales bacterium]|jgi:sigma-E factor negative regulatory protein RseC|nr:SoxR reducing system RseC family protein [Bacteroidales bacterium]MDI9572999.1 SoxR reducing system RseC family protein [Bacteroidota bacterium]OQC59364.1 MAG: SoxR reducing system protein RseC [Bacteroidetes bacterium ADurb.Bin012]MBP9511785.1 SoxR reducing system RseC family protein [Bacteroidales bacterium]MBP9588810.1 SoxR reducing system RseC family protein [Bacteroidales bacterium]
MSSTISHEGIVTRVAPEGIQVTIISQSACSACHAKGVCSISEMTEKIIDVSVPDFQEYHQGQRVVVEIKESEGSTAVLWGYVIPFIVLVVAFSLLYFLTHNELYAGLGSILSLIPYYLVLFILRNWMHKKFSFKVHPLE